jgi:cell division protein FtsB
MVKQTKIRVTSPKIRSKSPILDEFMRNSVISPGFQYSNYNSNYPISHQSHAPHTSHIDEVEDSEGYTSTSDESYMDDKSNGIASTISDESYANVTRDKDLKIYRMKDLLDRKRKLMFNKEREIKELGKQNTFLETVVDDYKKYNATILEEKIKQKRALKILSDHIREISKNIKDDEFRLNRVKMDQTALLQEIQYIRDEIAYVLNSSGNDTKYMSSDDEVQYNNDSSDSYDSGDTDNDDNEY